MISVCLATHNGEKYIAEQLDSILTQIGQDDEVVISDDGSTDNTVSIINHYVANDSRVKLFFFSQKDKKRFTSHELVSKNFENAIRHSKGRYIFLSDQDDVWLSNKVSRMLPYLSRYCVVVSNAYVIRDNNLFPTDEYIYTNKLPIQNYILRRGKYFGCCMAFDNFSLKKIILPFPNHLPLHDYFIGLIGELVGGAKYISEPLIYYRVHGGNTSSNAHRNTILYKISYRVRLMFEIYYRVAKFYLSCRRARY